MKPVFALIVIALATILPAFSQNGTKPPVSVSHEVGVFLLEQRDRLTLVEGRQALLLAELHELRGQRDAALSENSLLRADSADLYERILQVQAELHALHDEGEALKKTIKRLRWQKAGLITLIGGYVALKLFVL